MFNILEIGATGLVAQRTRMDTIANNVLNINTTRNEQGEKTPFRRRMTIFQAGAAEGSGAGGVHVKEIKLDRSPFQERYEPGHPDADSRGIVKYPNVDLSTEYVNMMEASRAYEANITMMDTAKAMYNASLRLIA
ncbi:MAG TPA: flagellar basal body rod protein FlgC [Tepidisphaeraceae bacterium]|jgi:flagellar basal-body rod protein FlgC